MPLACQTVSVDLRRGMPLMYFRCRPTRDGPARLWPCSAGVTVGEAGGCAVR